MRRTIVWFRRDLRVSDHAPLYRAARRGAVIPVFIFDRALLHHPETGAARVAFLLASLAALDQDLQERGGRLIVRSGDPVAVLPHLIQTTGAEGIYAHVDYERIYGRVRDARLNHVLGDRGMKIRWFEPPGGTPELLPYPSYRAYWYRDMRSPLIPTPSTIAVPPEVMSEPFPTLDELDHQPDAKPIPPGGTAAARQFLDNFLNEKSDRYYWQLSYPSASVTSGLGPYLKFGVISPRECVQIVEAWDDRDDDRIKRSKQQLISRLRWGSGFTQRFRYLPQLELRSLYTQFDDDGWVFDDDLYQAWQMGETGFPIVDAAARCLQATGGWWELNFRARAIYASFLSNLLGMDWRWGALHFMRHLIDGDCPIDHYQWAMQAGVTHCADKTWTRIYNPEQVAVDRCDPEGAFIKRWVPELAHLDPAQLGKPPKTSGYPAPILRYRQARQRRVQQLTQQRSPILAQVNVVPFLARMPADVTPFGSDRYASNVGWVQLAQPDTLFPAAIDLAAISPTAAIMLRTWFVAHVNIQPWRPQSRRSRRRQRDDSVQQLALWTEEEWADWSG